MTFLGVVGIFLGFLALPFAIRERSRLRLTVFLFAYMLHVAATLFYWRYSLTNISDATGYYDESLKMWTNEFGLATQFVYWSVQTIKSQFGGTFLDYFLLYQALGFYGISALMRIFEELYAELGLEQPAYAYFLLLLPSFHFWTSAIGKDGALFFGVCLAMWGFMDVRKRLLQLTLALIIMGIFRPHIALIAGASAAFTLLFDQGTSRIAKAALLSLAIIGIGIAASTVRSTFAIDVTDADSMSDFLARHSEVTADASTAGNSAVYGSYPVRLLSLLFRPFFVDAEGALGLVASAENLLLLFLIASICIRGREAWAAVKSVSFLRFAAVFGICIAFLLSLLYYNVGLGLRQKTMFTPTIVLLFAALMAIRRARAESAVLREEFLPAQGGATPARAG